MRAAWVSFFTPSPFSLRPASRNWAGAKPAWAARSKPARRFRRSSAARRGLRRNGLQARIRRPARWRRAAWRIAGLIEAGSASMCAFPVGTMASGAFAGPGAGAWGVLRAIDPVTSPCGLGAITVEGSKNDGMLPIWPVASGSAAPRGVQRALGRRHRPARRGRRLRRIPRCGVRRAERLDIRQRRNIGEQQVHRGQRRADNDDGDAGRDQHLFQEQAHPLAARRQRVGHVVACRHRHRCRHRRCGIGCGIGAAGIACGIGAGARNLRFARGLLFLERPEAAALLRGLLLRHLHRGVEIGGLRGIAGGGDRRRLAGGIGGRSPEAAQCRLGRGDAGRGRARPHARHAAAGLERRVGRQVGIDRLARGPARHGPAARLRLRRGRRHVFGFRKRRGTRGERRKLDRCGGRCRWLRLRRAAEPPPPFPG